MFDFTPAPAETKPDVFTLEALYPWLQSFPPERGYNYMDCNNCLHAQFRRACAADIFPLSVARKIERIAYALPHTFGAAAERCHAAMEIANV